MKIGLLGAGYIAASHAKALRAVESVELRAVCDLSRGRAEAVAAQFGIPEVFDSLDALAASSCDAVHILLPPALHLDAARTLIEAGKDVLLEKPMGLASADCRALTALAAARGRKLGVNHNFLFAPAYQRIREAVRSGALGPIDQLALNWLYPLPLLQFGPFDNWMVRQPANLVFELMPHLAAFAVDLIGAPEILAAQADNAVTLPAEQRVYRRWSVLGRGGRAGLSMTMSVAPGETDRSLTLRALGGIARFDFERGLGWIEAQRSDNPVFEHFGGARRLARDVARDARGNFTRYLGRLLRKRPGGNPFEESIAESIRAFYAAPDAAALDPRLSGGFGSDVIALCEDVVRAAGIGENGAASAAVPAAPPAPRVLVIGGTGFIGKRLVERLVAKGVGVRVLTRGVGSARIELAGLGVELMQGSHGDRATLDRALAGIDTVYHLAKAEGRRWEDYLANDVEPTRTLAEAAIEHGVRRFVYTGTIDSYASADAGDTITGDTPLDRAIGTRNLYARSKAMCEGLLKALAATRGLPLVIFRPGVVIGAGSPPAHLGVAQFVSATRLNYWGDGANAVPFVLVDDVADALALALDAPGIDGETFLLTDAPLMTARDYVAAIDARAGTTLAAAARPAWRGWAFDAVKEAAKHAIRHPNRRAATLHDWACRSHRARYDSAKTIERLGWRPAGSREALIERGINASVDRFMR